MVKTKNLRPKGFPEIFGNDFFLIGYRIFVKYTDIRGKRLRGLYIIKSETDSRKMELLGKLFTRYNYSTTDIKFEESDDKEKISSVSSGIILEIGKLNTPVPLPTGSPFNDWKQARRYAGPLPFTFSCDAVKKEILIIEGIRQNWTPQPLHIITHQFKFLQESYLKDAVLCNAFEVNNIPYLWKKGRVEKWK